MFIDIEKIPINDFFGKNFDKNESYKNELLQNIKMAEFMQKQRFRDHRRIKSNSDMQLMEIRNCCSIDEESRKILTDASKNLNLSNRGYLRTLKIARTIADLEGKTNILSSHILEAIQYRQLIKNQDSSILCQ
jgi:magnesium chelatase family protein